MEITICYIVAYLAEAFIIKQYCSILFHSKHPLQIELLTILAIYGILFAISFIENPVWNIASFLILNFILMLFLYDIKWTIALFHSIIVTIVMGLTELVFVSIITNLATTFYSSDVHFKNAITLMLTSKPFYFLFLYVIAHMLARTSNTCEKATKKVLYFSIIPLISFWITLTFIAICYYIELPATLNRMITLCYIFLLIANLGVYAIYTYSSEKNRQFTDLQLQLQKEHDSVSYYKMLLTRDEAQNILIHDIKKHLQAIAVLNAEGRPEKIAPYIDRLCVSSDLQTTTRLCDHEFLNAILSRYMHDCRELHIDFYPDIRSRTLHFIAENDLTSLFCNLLDNAVESAAKQINARIQLIVTYMPQAELTVITVVNSCRTNPFQKNGKLVSAKKDSARHGMGLKSVERIVTRYHGNMNLYYDEGERLFHAVVTLKSISSCVPD